VELQKFKVAYKNLIDRMAERMNETEAGREIIDDGVMKPEIYFSKDIRLSWILKEPYDDYDGKGGGWSYFDMFPEGQDLYKIQFHKGHKSTWHPMIYISYSIQNGFLKWNEMNYIREDHSMCDVVRYTAFVNTQKLPSKGLTNTNHADLWDSVSKYGDLLKEQLDLLSPNVMIFAYTFGMYSEMLGINGEKLSKHGTCHYLVKDGKLYISAYHPSQRTVIREKYVNDIVSVVEKWNKGELS
jgi:hypothetical protein